jgi:hypothetical protein
LTTSRPSIGGNPLEGSHLGGSPKDTVVVEVMDKVGRVSATMRACNP